MSEIESFDDFIVSIDQTIPRGNVNEEETVAPERKSPKRGRPSKPKPVQSVAPPPACKPTPPLPDFSYRDSLCRQISWYKNSPVFKEKFQDIKITDKTGERELEETLQYIKSSVSQDFSRKLVYSMFCQGMNMTEMFMVNFMEFEEATGISKEISDNKDDFKEELEELSMSISNKYQAGPLVRLIAKVGMNLSDILQKKIEKKKNVILDVKF